MREGVLRPMTDEEIEAFMAASTASYAEDLIAAGQAVPENAAQQARDEFAAAMDTEGTEQKLCAIENDTGLRVGFLWYTLMPKEEVLYVSDLLIDEAYRRQGHGRRAMLALEPAARALGYALALHVHAHNQSALALYRSLGYAVVQSGDGSIYMRKTPDGMA